MVGPGHLFQDVLSPCQSVVSMLTHTPGFPCEHGVPTSQSDGLRPLSVIVPQVQACMCLLEASERSPCGNLACFVAIFL